MRYATGEEELYDLAADPFELAEPRRRSQLGARSLDAGGRGLRELCVPPPPGFETPPGVAVAGGASRALASCSRSSAVRPRGGSRSVPGGAGRLSRVSYSPGPGSRVPIPRSRRRLQRRRAARRRGFAAFLGLVVVVIAVMAWAGGGRRRVEPEPAAHGLHPGRDQGRPVREPARRVRATGPQIVPGETPIEHVVFIVKENRTFNNYFATYPGAEGATEGGTIECDEDGCRDGPVVQLQEGADVAPHDLTHCFRCGLVAINGGKMNGFNRMNGVIPQSVNADLYGADLSGYVYLDRDTIPNYWAYADRFVLADHFFTSMYGPTLPEHLYTVAAQANFIVDNKSTADTPGSYCDDSTEHATRFVPREVRENDRRDPRARARDHANGSNTYDLADYWGSIRLCFDIEVLPDQLEEAGISW